MHRAEPSASRPKACGTRQHAVRQVAGGQPCCITRNSKKVDKKSMTEDIRKGRWRSTSRKEDEEMDGTHCLRALDDDTFIFLLHNGGLECRDNSLVKDVLQPFLCQG